MEQDIEINIALENAAKAHGIPPLLPLMDLEEKQSISVKELLATDAEKILVVSARYDVASILSAKLVKQRRCWRSEWALHFNNKVERWTNACSDLKTNLDHAMQPLSAPDGLIVSRRRREICQSEVRDSARGRLKFYPE
ncbi:DUF2066 domain-containing protein [Bathymodiolus japonicus methanotrophic gill symbiont]|uniref:DUF2066 domain-containing protein n=1 Tax=Bathymodiolus japonicus methanotrophic gill symbiont TaxID=113269 RepID=UPI003B832929